MATITLTFNSPINMSCKVGDSAYYTPITVTGGFDVDSGIYLIGNIDSITDNGTTVVIVCQATGGYSQSVQKPDFIFFSKNNLLEIGSIAGYYAKAKYKNNSPHPAELYATACGIAESSK